MTNFKKGSKVVCARPLNTYMRGFTGTYTVENYFINRLTLKDETGEFTSSQFDLVTELVPVTEVNTAFQQMIRQKIQSFNGKVFRVEFLKKDGSLRKMTCRTGVSKGVTGRGKTLDILKNPNLITVTDMVVASKEGVEKAYRVLSLDQIKYLACGGDILGAKDVS